MSWFPGADLRNDSDPFVATSPRTPQHHHQVDAGSEATADTFSDSHSSIWHTSMPHGLGLFTLPPKTEPEYRTTTAETHENQPVSWPSQLTPSLPHISTPQIIRRDSCRNSDQSCDPLSTLLRPQSSCSPGRSEYSHPSAVSSPYTQSDIYQRIDSPQIKIEYPDNALPQFNISYLDAEHEQQRLSVNPTDLMGSDQYIEDRLRTYLASSSSSDNGDYKPVQRETQRRPHSFGDIDGFSLNGRRKRALTNQDNAQYSCHKCGRLFQRAYNLKSHLSNVHGNKTKQHQCSWDGCTHAFVRKTDLSRHVESVHLKNREYKCCLCGKDFPRKDTLTRHVDDGCPKREKVRRKIKPERSL